ncbi:MAG: vacuolar trafficking protein [Monoraphidium minutum]|nr:MAG: vacuolar trafficking protein [Monoraphidium minutum]
MGLHDSRGEPRASILILALMFSTGVLLQLLGCILYRNYWPMLTGIMYVLVPMPYLFFGGGGGDSYGYSSIASGWVDAGKFLTGFSAVGSIAIPAILAHAQVITTGALLMELAAVAVLGATFVVYDYFASQDSSY